MLFPSEIFIFVFLPIVVILYFGIFRRWTTAKNIFLFVVSILFYAYGEPAYIFLMLLVIVINYLPAILLDKLRKNRAAILFLLTIMIITDLGILLYFKYSEFIIVNLNNILGSKFIAPSVRLPIGISFFIFQAMSYVIDIYRKHGEVQKNPINTGLYIAFFPQLIAGPIVRYETIAEQIKNRRENLDDFCKGISRFILGLGKKVILANQFAIVADSAFENVYENSFAFLWLGAISYTLQIFFDFSGYSDMAIGLGKIFGFHFEENFNYPYISGSISEFWRRWHISLQTSQRQDIT